MSKIDARGLSCPQPVILAKKAVDKKENSIEVSVDNNVALNNVKKFLVNAGYNITIKEINDDFVISAIR